MLTIDYPEGLETAVSTTRQELEAQIRLMAALKMFELNQQFPEVGAWYNHDLVFVKLG